MSDPRGLLAKHGFRFSKSMGQNFLVDDAVPRRIAEAAGLSPETHTLEIGPGVGALTARLCALSGFVTAVELDRALLPILGETLADCGNVEIVHGDALKLDVAALLARRPQYPDLRVCANLPYNITAPLLTRLLEQGLFRTITVMVQREAARRLAAAPGTADYGAFSVFTQVHAGVELLFDVGPESFLPQPKVVSTVVRLTPRGTPPEIEDTALFFRVVRAAFAQRRKTLVNALHAVFGAELDKSALTAIVTGAGFDARVRGETLGIPEFARVAMGVARGG